MRRAALGSAALVVLLPACQAIWGIDSLSGDGICVPCYTGPSSTKDVGACRAGCKDASGACQGEVTPSAEVCSTADVNESCNGTSTCTGELAFNVSASTYSETDEYAAVAPDTAGGLWATGTTRAFLRLGNKKVTDGPANFPYLVHFGADGRLRSLEELASDTNAFGWGIAVSPNGDPVVVGAFTGQLGIGPFKLSSTGIGGFIALFDGETGHAKWAKRFSTNDVSANGLLVDVSVAADGTIVTCGSLNGDFIGPSGQGIQTSGQDLVLARFDAAGHEQWTRTYGSIGNQNCEWLGLDADGGIAIAGSYESVGWTLGSHLPASDSGYTPYVARLTSDGKPRWSRAFTGSKRGVMSGVGVDPTTNDVIAGGSFTGKIDLGAAVVTSSGLGDVFVARLNDAGEPVGASRFGDASDQNVGGLRVDGAGQILVTGQLDGTLDFDGCEVTSSGGPSPAKKSKFGDAYVAKLSPDLHGIWCARAGTPKARALGQSIASDAEGGVVAGGAFTGTFSFPGGAEQTCEPATCSAALFFARFAP